jgi:hypothetical protein
LPDLFNESVFPAISRGTPWVEKKGLIFVFFSIFADIPIHLFNIDHHDYTEEQKKFASTLYFYSPKAYMFARQSLPLPSPSSIKRYDYFFFSPNFLLHSIHNTPTPLI